MSTIRIESIESIGSGFKTFGNFLSCNGKPVMFVPENLQQSMVIFTYPGFFPGCSCPVCAEDPFEFTYEDLLIR